MLVFNIISVLFLFICTERKLEETRKEGEGRKEGI